MTARSRSGTLVASLAIVAACVLAGFLRLGPSWQYYITLAMAFAIAAIGLDLFTGYGGRLTFGQGAFLGIGAYAATIFRLHVNGDFYLSLIVGAAAAAAVGAAFGPAVVRLGNFGAGISTFFFAYLATTLLAGNTLDSYTHSGRGLAVPPVSSSFGPLHKDLGLFLITAALLALVVIVTSNYANSRTGRSLRLIKRSEVAATVLGVRPKIALLVAFVYAAALAGLAGALVGSIVGYLAPESYDPSVSVTIFAMAAVGGLGSIAGPILGSVFFTLLPPYTEIAQAGRAVLFSGVLLATLIFLPEGLYGLLERMRAFFRPSPRRSHVASSARSERSASPQIQTSAPILSVEALTVRFGGIAAVNEVSLKIEPGTIHALVGPNGAGKTTVLNCVSGIQPPSGGRIVVFGHDLATVQPHLIRRMGLARTFQHPSLVADLTVQENVALGLFATKRWPLWRDLLGSPATRKLELEVRDAAWTALDMVGIPVERREMLAGELTLGEQKLVDIARAVAGVAQLVLLDEPTAGLSEEEIDRVVAVVRTLRERHALSIGVIAHHIGFVKAVADAVTVMDAGFVIAAGTADEVFGDQRVIDAFVGAAEPSSV